MATWGPTTITNPTTGASTTSIANVGTFPVVSGATLDSISLYITNLEGSTNFRLAVYQGGTSDANPSGATLVGETAQTNNGGTANAWATVTVSGSPALASGTRTWIVAKAASNAFAWTRRDELTDLIGNIVFSGETGGLSPSTAWPATMDNTAQNVASGNSFAMYLTYSTPSGALLHMYFTTG